MAASDSAKGKGNVFFTPGLADPKPNIISLSIVKKVVEELGLSDAYSPRVPILDESLRGKISYFM